MRRFPRCLPLEVLDRVRDVDGRPVDARGLERLVEEASGRADEGLAGPVLLVARLLADEARPGSLRPLAEDRLRADLPEMAATAAGGGLA